MRPDDGMPSPRERPGETPSELEHRLAHYLGQIKVHTEQTSNKLEELLRMHVAERGERADMAETLERLCDRMDDSGHNDASGAFPAVQDSPSQPERPAINAPNSSEQGWISRTLGIIEVLVSNPWNLAVVGGTVVAVVAMMFFAAWLGLVDLTAVLLHWGGPSPSGS
jgi:hypothetical protein